MGLFEKLQARLEVYRLEQKYTKRKRRQTMVMTANYVDGEYLYDSGSSSYNYNYSNPAGVGSTSAISAASPVSSTNTGTGSSSSGSSGSSKRKSGLWTKTMLMTTTRRPPSTAS